MAERRSLIDGIETVEDMERAEDFIYAEKPARKPKRLEPVADSIRPAVPSVAPASHPSTPAALLSSPIMGVARVPVGGRIRIDIATDLKRISLERQLQGIEPYAVQDILEEAIQLWMHTRGRMTQG
jgi:hypothetical protein